jgi:hypothetical protein
MRRARSKMEPVNEKGTSFCGRAAEKVQVLLLA